MDSRPRLIARRWTLAYLALVGLILAAYLGAARVTATQPTGGLGLALLALGLPWSLVEIQAMTVASATVVAFISFGLNAILIFRGLLWLLQRRHLDRLPNER